MLKRLRMNYAQLRCLRRARAGIFLARPLAAFLGFLLGFAALQGHCADPNDPILNLLLQKGIVTEQEVEKAKAQAEAIRTNELANLMPPMESKWRIGNAIKNIELFGDIRMRYEDRRGTTPDNSRLQLDRARFALRLGLRGDLYDNFYYGLRLETAANPRSPWVTLGTASSGIPYNGPYGKSTSILYVGQIYLGWRPGNYFDLTLGRMPNPLYTTPMVWDSDLNPEGLAERFKYTVGEADFFATFGQFLYQDTNPTFSSGGFGNSLGLNPLLGQQTTPIFQLAYEGGITYHFPKDITAKVAAAVYQYLGMQTNVSPFFGDPFVGEGAFTGPGSAWPVNGVSGYGTSSSLLGQSSLGFPNNQVGLNHLLILEIPAEVNFNIWKFNARLFGDFAYNLEGAQRAEDAAAGYATYLAQQAAGGTISVKPFPAQRNDVKAYQIGFGIGNQGHVYGPMQGLVYGTVSKKHSWEFRTYWQHVEQYALDPNIIDSDFFEGRGNLEGIYAALAYGFTDNVIGTLRYGYAHRINELLGTGGSNQDMPQINPIEAYNLLQVDLTMRF